MSDITAIAPKLQTKQAEAIAARAKLPVILDLLELRSAEPLDNDTLVTKAREKHIALLAGGMILCTNPFDMDVRTIKTLTERAGYTSRIFVTTSDIIDAVFESAGEQRAMSADDSDPFTDSKAQRKLDEILEQGIHFGASDIHIEIRPSQTAAQVDPKLLVILLWQQWLRPVWSVTWAQLR